MRTPHDGADHTGNGSSPSNDQPSSTIPAGEYIIGGPGFHLCSAMKKTSPPEPWRSRHQTSNACCNA